MSQDQSSLTPEPITKLLSATLTDEEYDQREFLQRICKQALKHAVDARRRYDYEWMVRDLFRRGYHFSKYIPSTQTVILASRQTARLPINLIAAQMRSIRNQVTSFKPKYEVLPRYTTQESKSQARYTGRLLDYFFDHLNFNKKIKETVTQGLMYSVGGPWQVYYDEEKKEVRVYMVDPFDFYFDPLGEDLDDCEYVIKAVRRPLAEIIYNPQFDMKARKQVTGGEARLAVSEYKQFMIQTLRYLNQYDAEENKNVILFEGDFRIRNEQTGKAHMRKVIWTDQNLDPLDWQETDENEHDYAIYQADLNPKEILGEGWMKHVLPINRAINSLESSVFDYNYRVAKGRFIIDRDSGVRSISNIHGEIISKNRGSEVRAMDLPPLPVAVAQQIDRLNRYSEDIGGAHDASLGRVPAGVKSGIGVAELKQADTTNQADLVDNLEDFLTIVARKMLKKVSKHYSTYQVVHALGIRENDEKAFAVIGSESKRKGNMNKEGQIKIGPDWVDLAIIGEDNNVRVTIGSWLGYTKEMMQQTTLKLAQAGLIDQKTFLRIWEFGNVDEIVQESRKDALLKNLMNKQQQPGAPEQPDPDIENDMMVLEGKDMPVDMHDDHALHIIIHQDALGRGHDDLVIKHISIHQMYIGEGKGAEDISPLAQGDQARQQAVTQQQSQGPSMPTPQSMPQQAGPQQGMTQGSMGMQPSMMG